MCPCFGLDRDVVNVTMPTVGSSVLFEDAMTLTVQAPDPEPPAAIDPPVLFAPPLPVGPPLPPLLTRPPVPVVKTPPVPVFPPRALPPLPPDELVPPVAEPPL